MDFDSVVVYVTHDKAMKIKELCEKHPYLSCVVDSARDCGTILGEKVYAVDLFFDK